MTAAVQAFRSGLRVAGWPARTILVGLIRLYRVTLSGMLGGQCRFEPTCSHYGEQAVRSHGAVRGSLLSARRILRCSPFSAAGLDPVPPSFWDAPRATSRPEYDTVTQPGTPRVAFSRETL